MSVINLLIFQLGAHLITDYHFQNQRYAEQKNAIGFKSSFLPWHALIAFLSSWILSFQVSFVYISLMIGMTHYVIDGLKMFLNRDKRWNPYAYFIDQFLHISIIVIGVILYSHAYTGDLFTSRLSTKYLLVALSFLACTKPANILIKQIFHLFEIKIVLGDELPNAGKLIGILERWLILIFVLSHYFEAIGFLIAAKSILRFKNDDSVRSEYVLIGTMLSFGIALIFGVIINRFC